MSALLDAAEPTSLADLRKGIRVPRADFELWLEKHDWTWQQLSRNEFPDFVHRRYYTRTVKMRKPFTGVAAFQLACVCNDPVLFARMFLREPTDPRHKDPYSLFDYQERSARIMTHTIHKCGAGVGKTREMILLCTFYFHTEQNGSGLVGAPQQTHLDDIIEGIVEQHAWNDDLAPGLKHHKKHPHHTMYGANDFKLWFRPAGHDGEAFRGRHAQTFAMYEEAAKADQDTQWTEFFRAVEHGCIVKPYSVPDGRRDTHFYRIAKLAEGVKDADEAKSLQDALKNLGVGGRKFVLCKFPKTMMPPPHWDEAVKAESIERYGGEDKPGYKHNILAEDGDPENTVFPWNEFKWVVKDAPEYRFLKVVVSSGEVIVRGYRYELKQGTDGPIARPVTIVDATYPLAGFFEYELLSTPSGVRMSESGFRKLIKSFFPAAPGLKRGGGDFGFSQDPTELIVRLVIGKVNRRVARLQLRHVTYDMQCQALDAMDDVYGPLESLSWGTDFGNAGSAVAHDLYGLPQYGHKNYEDRLKGFQFESTTDNMDENGDPIIDAKDGKPVKITLKELATDHLVREIQRQVMEFPPDPETISNFTGHTCTQGKHRIYDKSNDHDIDAERALKLAEILGTARDEPFAVRSNVR